MKFKYLKSDMTQLVKIFDENNVKLTFEDFNNLYSSFEKIIDVSTQIKVKHCVENFYASSAKEYDLKKQKIVSTGKGYRYSSIDYFPDQKIRKNIELLRKMFHYFPKGIFNIDSTFGIAYRDETSLVEGYYFAISNGNIPALDDNLLIDIFDVFNLSKVVQEFLFSIRRNPDLFDIEYIGMTFSGLIAKVGFVTPIFMFMQSDYQKYKEYKKFLNVLDILREMPVDYGLGIQYVTNTNYENYIALEYVIAGREESLSHLDSIRQRKIIKAETYDKTKQFLENEIFDGIVFKYKWENKDDINIKLYLEKDNPNFTPFIV